MDFIRPELFIIIVFIYCVGRFLKLNKKFNNDWMIPYILLGVSFLITLAYVSFVLGEGFSPPVIVAVIIQAVLIAAVAVFGNELIKQVLFKRKE
jgi:hypothetical protein